MCCISDRDRGAKLPVVQGRGSVAERLYRKQEVGSSILLVPTKLNDYFETHLCTVIGEVAEWTKATHC